MKEEKRLADLALGPKPSNANYGQTSAGATGTVAGLSAGIAKRDVADVDKPLTAMAAQQQPKQQPKQQQIPGTGEVEECTSRLPTRVNKIINRKDTYPYG